MSAHQFPHSRNMHLAAFLSPAVVARCFARSSESDLRITLSAMTRAWKGYRSPHARARGARQLVSKIYLALWFLAFVIGAGTGIASQPVNEGPGEFSAVGDFDGDGRLDIVLLDKQTGNYRIGYQPTDANIVWAKARPSGVENATGFTVGRMLDSARDALAVASPEANRVNILTAVTKDVVAGPVSVFSSSIGPCALLALNVPGSVNAAWEDLCVGACLDSPPSPNRLVLMRNTTGAFTELSQQIVSDPTIVSLNPVRLKTGGAPLVGAVFLGAQYSKISVNLPSVTGLQEVTKTTFQPPLSRMVSGQFGSPGSTFFILHAPGGTNLSTVALNESLGTYTLGSEAIYSLGRPIRQLFVVDHPAGSRLLVVFDEGETAALYSFDGLNPPSLIQEFKADAGQYFTSAAGYGGGNFIFFSGTDKRGISTSFKSYTPDGKGYKLIGSGSLPSVSSLSAPANVFLFQTEPFVTSYPNLLLSLNIGDWSSSQVAGPIALPHPFYAENYGGASQGLAGRVETSLGPVPSSAKFGLVNQYSEPVSLFSFSPASGQTVADVRIAPQPGLYPSSIIVSFTNIAAGVSVVYRYNQNDHWILYTTPFRVFKKTTVSYFGKLPGKPEKSAIRGARYEFTAEPGKLDSDGDGVPDFVEIANQLDPVNSGVDGDGDGYSDLQEIMAGTSPTSTNSYPNGAKSDMKASFDVTATPRPIDGTTGQPAISAWGTPVRGYSLPGGLLAFNLTQGTIFSTASYARLTNIVYDSQLRLVVLATDPHFDIKTASVDTRLGRELVALRPAPEVSPVEVPYSYGGGDIPVEANAWVAKAKVAFAAAKRPNLLAELTPRDTLVALLMERALSRVLIARGIAVASNLTLFPFRAGDQARWSLSAPVLDAVETSGGQPAYLISAIYSNFNHQVTAANSLYIDSLNQLAGDVYRLSSASNNAAPGRYPLPVDVLRDFLVSGNLQSNYLADTALPAAALDQARTGANMILASMVSRPVTNVVLRVTGTEESGMPSLTATDGALFHLFERFGKPYLFPEAFDLLPNSDVEVLGYTDLSPSKYGVNAIEVVDVRLAAVPPSFGPDSDGNGLPDEWELQFFQSLGNDPNADPDQDSFTNLQEMQAGTDPTDNLSIPSGVPPPPLKPPVVAIALQTTGTLKLSWSCPASLIDKVKYTVKSTTDLGAAFNSDAVAPVYLGNGLYELNLPNPGAGQKFYTITISYK